MNALPPNVEALCARLGLEPSALSDVDRARAEAAIEDATSLVLAEAPAPVAAKWEESGAPRVVVTVILKAARREFENPRQLNQEQLGEHMVGISATSGVYLTDREVAQIKRAAAGGGSTFVGCVRTPIAYGEGDTRIPLWETRWPYVD
jgi:hypothetical protein